MPLLGIKPHFYAIHPVAYHARSPPGTFYSALWFKYFWHKVSQLECWPNIWYSWVKWHKKMSSCAFFSAAQHGGSFGAVWGVPHTVDGSWKSGYLKPLYLIYERGGASYCDTVYDTYYFLLLKTNVLSFTMLEFIETARVCDILTSLLIYQKKYY